MCGMLGQGLPKLLHHFSEAGKRIDFSNLDGLLRAK
jgi:hypothetical protein